MRSKIEPAPASSPWLPKIGWTQTPATEEDLEEKKSAVTCRLCMARFSMIRMRSKNYCPLCEVYVCNKCFTGKLEHPGKEGTVTATVCRSCGDELKIGKKLNKFKKAVNAAQDYPLAYYHNIVRGIFKLVRIKIAEFRENIEIARVSPRRDSRARSMKIALKLETELTDFFKNIRLGMQQIKKVKIDPAKSPHDVRLKKNILSAITEAMRSDITIFTKLSEKRERIASGTLTAADNDTGTEQQQDNINRTNVNNKHKQEDDSHTLEIMKVEPAIVALEGDLVKIFGKNFTRKTKVKFAGVNSKQVKFISAERLEVQAPPRKQDGMCSVIIYNSKSSCSLDNGFLYSAQMSKIMQEEDARRIAEEKSQSDEQFQISTRDPQFTSMAPAASPLEGTRIEIGGENFCIHTRVSVGDVEVKPHYSKEHPNRLVIRSPRLSAGAYNVEIWNPHAINRVKDTIIYYDPKMLDKPSSPPRQRDVWADNSIQAAAASNQSSVPSSVYAVEPLRRSGSGSLFSAARSPSPVNAYKEKRTSLWDK
eukprot:TRINITY_DN8623_c0_g1_i1.p1 TRINITY_DN8623_c0_g1~~TRINITY_DN8623_c0_g1_i1.p1  ORF type:complete len:608 (-),score=93.66 TRINITY_DN8623_c0_g1_i1:40-1644(-)